MKKNQPEKKRSINNPHDKFFKTVFGDRQNAIDFVKVVLPDNLKKYMNINAMQRGRETLLLKELKELFVDIVYDCPLMIDGKQTKVKISMLFEHKSRQPKEIKIQLGLYIFSCLYNQVQKGEKLSIVLPLVVYHGLKRWKIRRLNESFEYFPDEFRAFLPDFDYVLIDLRSEKLEKTGQKFNINNILRISMMLMHQIFSETELQKNASKVFAGIENISAESTYFETMMLYLLNEIKNKGKIMETIIKDDLTKSQKALTLAEQYKLEGMIEGKIEGKIEEKKNAYLEKLLSVINLIKVGLDDAIIAESLCLKTEIVSVLRRYYLQQDEALILMIKSGDILLDEKLAFKPDDETSTFFK